jgi:pyrroline-5-carboxylate reductase
MLASTGRVVLVEDSLMDAVTGLSGSGPAFVFVLIEALADGGVAAGLPRAMAQELAAQTVFGAAKMVLESGQHPGQLKDMVASPGGTTIAGLAVLEESNFRGALVRAVRAAAQRSRELSEAK